jgi:CheY-like chemotaxis protein
MPLMDGLGFLQRLRQQDPGRSTPVAIVTGDYFIDDEIATELEGLGATLRFKPIWLEDVVRLTHTLVTGPPFVHCGR